MGYLDHSTNNIIVDAVLTDIGREFLARNDGSYSIVKFALGDDEVDYTRIQKFGRTVGKEKIEKNILTLFFILLIITIMVNTMKKWTVVLKTLYSITTVWQ
jgi:hypothetical protein